MHPARRCRSCDAVLTTDNPRADYCGATCRTRSYYARRSSALAEVAEALQALRALTPPTASATLALIADAEASLTRAGYRPAS